MYVYLRTYFCTVTFITDIKDINLTLLRYSWVKNSFVYFVLCILLTLGYVLLFLLFLLLLLLLLLIKSYNLYKVLACSTTFFQLSLFCATFFQLPVFVLFISSKTSSSQRVLGLPIALLDMGFHLVILCNYYPQPRAQHGLTSLAFVFFLINPTIFCPFNISLISRLVLILQ